MTKADICNEEIRQVLEKHGCKIKVSALLTTEGNHFMVETVLKDEEHAESTGA